MLRLVNTLAGRLAGLQLLIYAVLLPILFVRLDTLARHTATSAFTQRARAYSSALAREIEFGTVLESMSRTVQFLDSAVESGGCSYAAVLIDDRLLGSSLVDTPAWVGARGDDVTFARSADKVYAVTTLIHRSAGDGVLYLGFDKRQTLDALQAAHTELIESLALYGLASVLAVALLARLVSAPLRQLRAASRRVARGEVAVKLATSSPMLEIADLSRDLDSMRAELVGTADRLRDEMEQRRAEHLERSRLEVRLRNEQRLATIGTFAGGLAHEFNNILVPLTLYAEEALDELEPGHPVRADLDRVVRSATRAGNVIAKLLAFTRPAQEQQAAPVDFGLAVDEALDLFQALIPAHIELRRENGARGVHVLGDATLLNQVVVNLCSNAIQAMLDRGGMLTVSVATRRQPLPDAPAAAHTEIVELRVRDTGHGMNPETRERIFEPYFTTREVGEGSGLGLFIVHGIVASMGGQISVTSTLQEGTEFLVELPAV
jgi:signal transduction histidine kinase